MKKFWVDHYSNSDWQKAFLDQPEIWKEKYQEIKSLLNSSWFPPNFPSKVPQMFGMAYGIGQALNLRKVLSIND